MILDQQYPDQYIALFGKALDGYLVIAHDPSLKKLNDYLGRLRPLEREKIIIHFTGECAPNTLEVHFDSPSAKAPRFSFGHNQSIHAAHRSPQQIASAWVDCLTFTPK